MSEAVLTRKPRPTDEEIISTTDVIITECSGRKGALIPVLQSTQGAFGYLPEIALKRIGERMNIPFSEVAGVVSFYKFFSTVPQGKYVVRVCLGTSCYVRGGKEVLDSFRDALKIEVEETSADDLFTLKVGRCFGACGLAPVVMINDEVFRRVKPSLVEGIIQSFREKEAENGNQ